MAHTPFVFSYENILREEFKKADSDGNKVLDLEEFTKILNKYGVEATKAQAVFERNGGNGLSEEEFIEYVRRSEKLDALLEEYNRMFNNIDKDGNGFITPEELKQDWKEKGVSLSDASINALIKSFDMDADKNITCDGNLFLFIKILNQISNWIFFLRIFERSSIKILQRKLKLEL